MFSPEGTPIASGSFDEQGVYTFRIQKRFYMYQQEYNGEAIFNTWKAGHWVATWPFPPAFVVEDKQAIEDVGGRLSRKLDWIRERLGAKA